MAQAAVIPSPGYPVPTSRSQAHAENMLGEPPCRKRLPPHGLHTHPPSTLPTHANTPTRAANPARGQAPAPAPAEPAGLYCPDGRRIGVPDTTTVPDRPW